MNLPRLFVSIAAIAAGLGIITQLLSVIDRWESTNSELAFAAAYILGSSLIGFGLLHPFKRGLMGALLGFACAFMFGF